MEKAKRGKADFEDCNQIDRAQVLQEAKHNFMATSIKTKKLVGTLTKCIFILLQGEKLAPNEATDLFFHITRLFQYKDKDSTLRRLIYIGIKALSKQAENVYVVTSSLTTDVNSSKDDPAIRASALRALCQILDASTITSTERYLKQCVVDRHPVVASAAISSLIRIASVNNEIVKRCTNEIQEALNSDSPMVQYHALGLRYNSCRNDRLAVSRLITNCIQQGLKSPLATCLLIRIITNFINENEGEETRVYRDYIKSHLNNRSEMVEYEAANALVNLKSEEPRLRSSAVAHLRNFLTSSKPAVRFAAVRSLNRLAITAPAEVRECNLDLENLISQSDCNRSIAILAITTLLKTGTESSVEKFLKQIGEFLSEIDDGFKVIVVGSVRQLCQKYPSKHVAMMDFLTEMLREEGGYAYKKAIVDTIIKIIEDNDDTKEKGLEQLCEFIEDCEHASLAVEVLDLIRREGPKTKQASKYTRFIANRLLLDSSPVACAATAALSSFGTVPELTDHIEVGLKRGSNLHEESEPMDRAVFYENILSAHDPTLNYKFILDTAFNISFTDFEPKIKRHLASDSGEPFNFASVATADAKDIILSPLETNARDDDIDDTDIETKPADNNGNATAEIGHQPPENLFDDIELGNLIKSTKPIPLTDKVSEFGVQCTKYIYVNHVVLQFSCTNTVNNMHLEDVHIEACAPPGFCILASTECPTIAFGQTKLVYICVSVQDDTPLTMAYFTNLVLKYNYKTVDPDTNEPDDDESSEDIFPLEDLLIDLSDFMKPLSKDFKHVWSHQLTADDQLECGLSLPKRKLDLMVREIISMLGMEVHDGTDVVKPGKVSHEIHLAALYYGKTDILLKVNLVESYDTVAIKMFCRCQDKELAQTIIQMFDS